MIFIRKDSKKTKIKKIFLKCLLSSNSFPNINRTQNRLVKYMWLSFYCFCLALCAVMMVRSDELFKFLDFFNLHFYSKKINSILEYLNYDGIFFFFNNKIYCHNSLDLFVVVTEISLFSEMPTQFP